MARKRDANQNQQPDLVERWRHDWQLSPYKREFFYIPGGSAEGYSDYPFATEAQKVKVAA